MIICNKHKFICLNPPKTGTGFREKLLCASNVHLEAKAFYDLDGLGRHWNLDFIKKIEGLLIHPIESYFIFSYVRNPWQRAASWFHMRKYGQKNRNPNLSMKNMLKRFPSQKKYVEIDGLKVQYVGDCANQTDSIVDLFKRMNLHINVPNHLKLKNTFDKNRRELYKKYLDEESINQIAEIEKYIIDFMGYSFDL